MTPPREELALPLPAGERAGVSGEPRDDGPHPAADAATFSQREKGLVASVAAGRLRIVLLRAGDRIGHRVEWQAASGCWTQLAESIEGTPDERWPASPPLQEVHTEERGDATVALAVGRSGRAHWSASVEPRAAEERIVLDIACRAGEAPQRLGSAYRTAGGLAVELLTCAGGQAAVAQCGETLQIAVEPAAGLWPRTVRWQYAVALDPACPPH